MSNKFIHGSGTSAIIAQRNFRITPAGTNMKENMGLQIISARTAKRDFSLEKTSLCILDKADFDALIVLIITTPELLWIHTG